MRNSITIKLLMLMCAGLGFLNVYAQENSQLDGAISALNNIRKNYTEANSLSFEMMYRYSSENEPLNILDSLAGHVQVQKNKYHSLIDSTETISNDKYAVILFRDEKIMYLTKPSSVMKGIDSYAMLDSSLRQMPGITASISNDKQTTTIEFLLPGGGAYKKIVFVADSKSMLFRKIIYVMKADMAEPPGTPDEMKAKDEYAVVETDFFNYSTEKIDDAVFDEKKYFIKNKTDYSATEMYKEYKIFIGSPNL